MYAAGARPARFATVRQSHYGRLVGPGRSRKLAIRLASLRPMGGVDLCRQFSRARAHARTHARTQIGFIKFVVKHPFSPSLRPIGGGDAIADEDLRRSFSLRPIGVSAGCARSIQESPRQDRRLSWSPQPSARIRKCKEGRQPSTGSTVRASMHGSYLIHLSGSVQ
jgi:hypothetical protein